MMHSLTAPVPLLFVVLFLAPPALADTWSGWTCDELTPDLCDLQVEEGDVPVRGGLTVHYWRYRRADANSDAGAADADTDAPASSDSKLPIVMVHGGPSWPHNYMLPLKQQACRGRDVYFYDQAGCGSSALPPGSGSAAEDYPWLLDPAYYSEEELPAVLSHVGLDRYHILGSSWGTALAQLFALNASPGDGLASMVLSGPFSDAGAYIRAQWDEEGGNLGGLPPFVQERIRALAEDGAYDSPEYQAVDDVLTTFFTIRTAPVPDCFGDAASRYNAEIYVGMQGPSEFGIGGVLADFNVTGRLGELDMPVLLTSGRYDTMRPSIVMVMRDAIPRSEWVLLPRSGHCSMIDEPGPMNDAVADFLDRVEEGGVQTFVPRVWESGVTILHEESERVANDAMSDFPISAIAGTLFAFGVGVFVGNWRAARARRKGYNQI